MFELGDLVKKKSGSFWRGKVVGYYSTEQTPIGYCVQLVIADPREDDNLMPVQIYPESALEPALSARNHPYENTDLYVRFLAENGNDTEIWSFITYWTYGDWDDLDKNWPEWKKFVEKNGGK